MTHSEGDASLSRQRKGFTVQASPFNAVKLDLALIIIIAVVLLLVHDKLFESLAIQLGVLVGYGVIAMAWVIVRTRRIVARQAVIKPHNADDKNI